MITLTFPTKITLENESKKLDLLKESNSYGIFIKFLNLIYIFRDEGQLEKFFLEGQIPEAQEKEFQYGKLPFTNKISISYRDTEIKAEYSLIPRGILAHVDNTYFIFNNINDLEEYLSQLVRSEEV
jgi:hypothetical protein